MSDISAGRALFRGCPRENRLLTPRRLRPWPRPHPAGIRAGIWRSASATQGYAYTVGRNIFALVCRRALPGEADRVTELARERYPATGTIADCPTGQSPGIRS